MRYKELKFDGKIFTEQYKIDEILSQKGFFWFLDAEIENSRIEITNDTLIFNSGIWYHGIWKYGVFRNGEWRSGIFLNGVWYNGVWKDGDFVSGIIFNGTFLSGKIYKEVDIRKGDFKEECKIEKNEKTQPIFNQKEFKIKSEKIE